MIFRMLQIFGLILLLSSCNGSRGTEESIIVYDPIKKESFIHLLDEKKVNYRIQDDGQILYPAEQKDIVIEAFEKVTGRKLPESQLSP